MCGAVSLLVSLSRLSCTSHLYCPYCLSYSVELWPITVTSMKMLEATHHRRQRKILGVTWKDKLKNEEIRTGTGLQKVETIIKERKLRWRDMWWGWIMIGFRIRSWIGILKDLNVSQGNQGKTGKILSPRILRYCAWIYLFIWDEAAVQSVDRCEWRRCVAQCIYDARWT